MLKLIKTHHFNIEHFFIQLILDELKPYERFITPKYTSNSRFSLIIQQDLIPYRNIEYKSIFLKHGVEKLFTSISDVIIFAIAKIYGSRGFSGV